MVKDPIFPVLLLIEKYICQKLRGNLWQLFEDVETVMVVLRKRLLNTLYLCIAPHLCHLGVSTYVDFLNLLVVPPV